MLARLLAKRLRLSNAEALTRCQARSLSQPEAASPRREPPANVGQILEHLRCDSLAFGGQGVCKLNGFTVLVDNALPGEQLHAEVTAVKGGYATATKTETVKEHEGAVQAPCRYFGTCGGCSLQYLDYSLQLQYKDAQITDALQRLGKQQHAAAVRKPPLAAASPYHFRNKITLRSVRKPTPRFGLLVRGSHDVVPISECLLPDDRANHILRKAERLGAAAHMEGITIRQGEGQYAGQPAFLLVFHVVQRKELGKQVAPVLETTAAALQVACNNVRSIVARFGSVPAECFKSGANEAVLTGPGKLQAKLSGLNFTVSPSAFFQTNIEQAELLHNAIAEAAGLEHSKAGVLLDLCCGTGTIGLSLARYVKQVIGCDSNAAAIRDAKGNAERNGISNATFLCLDLTKQQDVQRLRKAAPQVDVAVADPARAGLGKPAIDLLLERPVSKLVYVSCNPPTQARDVALLCAPQQTGAYELTSSQAVDMFPQTSHIESVVLLCWQPRQPQEH